MTTEKLESFFNSSSRSAGLRLFSESKVSFLKPSSSEVTAYVKPSYRVILKVESSQMTLLTADCNCGPAQKGQLCKHIWATCLAVLEKSPDFFEGITEVHKKVGFVKTVRPQTESQISSQRAFKLKQDTYRKQLYQKQKERAKEFKNNKKKNFIEVKPTFPPSVQNALDYFSKNGFSLENSLNEVSVFLARKKLSRIFHPDVGGSHDEILELNRNSEILLNFVEKL